MSKEQHPILSWLKKERQKRQMGICDVLRSCKWKDLFFFAHLSADIQERMNLKYVIYRNYTDSNYFSSFNFGQITQIGSTFIN